jgi:hypothetical protein
MAAQMEILSPNLDRPFCVRCVTPMSLVLVRASPGRPGNDQRTYECPQCHHKITKVTKFPKHDRVEYVGREDWSSA